MSDYFRLSVLCYVCQGEDNRYLWGPPTPHFIYYRYSSAAPYVPPLYATSTLVRHVHFLVNRFGGKQMILVRLRPSFPFFIWFSLSL